MINYIVFSFVFLAFFLASIEDIKKREVYDALNYCFCFFIVLIALFDCFLSSSFEPLKYVLFGLFVGLFFGTILFYLGIWGGGDAKFLSGFGASIYYFRLFFNENIFLGNFFDFLKIYILPKFLLFFDLFLDFLFVINICFFCFFVFRFFFVKNFYEFYNLFFCFLIFNLIFASIFLSINFYFLLFFCFLSFVLVFFAKEDLFLNFFVRYKKDIFKLKKNDILDSNLELNSKVIINREKVKWGLEKHDILKIKKVFKKNFKVNLRFILPLSFLLGINFISFILKYLFVDKTNIFIMSFMLKFLFISFLVGGFLAIFIIIFFAIFKFKKVNFLCFKKFEFFWFLVFFGFFLILTLFSIKFFILFFLSFMYYFLKIAKQVENLIFVKKKDLNKIVLGDWIFEDIFVKKDKIFSKEDFKFGVEAEQLNKIKLLSKENLHLKKLYVKDGLAFIPPLFLGFILMFFI